MTDVRCVKCGRKLTHEPMNGMGPVCYLAAYGHRPKRERAAAAERDPNTEDMFPVELRFYEAVAGVSLEMA